MLSATLYPDMAEGPSWLVTGELFAEGWWHVSAFLHQHPNGLWRVGRETDSETWVLRHVICSKPARCGAHKVASKTERRELLRQIYEFVDAKFVLAAPAPSSSQGAARPPIYHKETTMTQCAVYTARGLGRQCPHTALEGTDTCKLHKFLESKLGQLPRAAVAVPAEITPAVEAAPLAVAARMTPDAMEISEPVAAVVEDAAVVEVAAVREVAAVVEEAPKKQRKVRKDKGTNRTKKS